jgi:hypothetical protein
LQGQRLGLLVDVFPQEAFFENHTGIQRMQPLRLAQTVKLWGGATFADVIDQLAALIVRLALQRQILG